MRLKPVQPLRVDRRPAFVDYSDRPGEYREIDVPVYPPPARGVRALRNEFDLSLREAARKLGLSAAQMSGLERGSLVPVDGWELAEEEIRRRFGLADHMMTPKQHTCGDCKHLGHERRGRKFRFCQASETLCPVATTDKACSRFEVSK